jgi:hypothetical protein
MAGPGQQTGVWERFSDAWCGCQAASRHPCRPHSDTREQQSQLLGAAQPRALPHLTLQDEHLLAQCEDLPVMITAPQTGEHRGQRRRENQKQVAEHTRRMTGLEGEVNAVRRVLSQRCEGLSGTGRLARGPHARPAGLKHSPTVVEYPAGTGVTRFAGETTGPLGTRQPAPPPRASRLRRHPQMGVA